MEAKTKGGYNCIKWEEEHNEKLRENYCSHSNEELGALIGRTADAVRKQLNKLKLRRPKKGELKELDKKAGKNPFFDAIKKGAKARKAQELQEIKAGKSQKSREKEREWAKKAYGVGEPSSQSPESKRETEADETKVWIVLNDRTRMLVPRGKEDFYRNKFDKYESDKWNKL